MNRKRSIVLVVSTTTLLLGVVIVLAPEHRTERSIASSKAPSSPAMVVDRSTRAGRPPIVDPDKPGDPRGPLFRYVSLRDDINPKPRLQLIDQWARDHEIGQDVTLLGEALVDPDPAVRERAQSLFDREWTRR